MDGAQEMCASGPFPQPTGSAVCGTESVHTVFAEMWFLLELLRGACSHLPSCKTFDQRHEFQPMGIPFTCASCFIQETRGYIFFSSSSTDTGNKLGEWDSQSYVVDLSRQ